MEKYAHHLHLDSALRPQVPSSSQRSWRKHQRDDARWPRPRCWRACRRRNRRIENIPSQPGHGGRICRQAILDAAQEVAVPAFVSTVLRQNRLRADVLPLGSIALPLCSTCGSSQSINVANATRPSVVKTEKAVIRWFLVVPAPLLVAGVAVLLLRGRESTALAATTARKIAEAHCNPR